VGCCKTTVEDFMSIIKLINGEDDDDELDGQPDEE
jgi:hypothetical protein